ncbi:lipolytic protein g-d-s-l family [Moniliophthora roreri MCA 2997]|uniref:Lipolytic protein g-d-s-l family n=1 Tax=Moniliophthora roreri (strain MCA 2997) TaxID=1381753 RepID=V2XI75_MONRO|nr:lipolytic protein g-d-s-l family [Moniliophthora roreri MCA 2997]
MFSSLLSSVVFACAASASVLSARQAPVRLAVKPNCGDLSGAPSDLNWGLKSLDYYKTIVAFGDSWTSGSSSDGSPLEPPVLSPPNPNAGGRVANGALWVEHLATAAGATLQDYAVNGSVVDATQYPANLVPQARDFSSSTQTYINYGKKTNPETTLYVIFMGIGDYDQREHLYNGQPLTTVADTILYDLLGLISPPVFARNILIMDNYGRGTKTSEGEAYKQELFDGLKTLADVYASQYGLNLGFVDFSTLWDGVLANPESFGFTSTGACTLNDQTTQGACADPDHTLYWIPGHPSKATHELMADYTQEVLKQCQARSF